MEKRFSSKRYCVDTETVMGQAAGLAGNYDDVINLSLGDPDIITPLPIIEQAFEDAKAGYTKYTDCRGYKELREEIAKYYTRGVWHAGVRRGNHGYGLRLHCYVPCAGSNS